MSAPRRWLRLDVTWSASAWVSGLRPGGRLSWVELLAYVKAHGIGGRAKGLTGAAAGRRWGIPARDVTEMLAAAVADGALTIEPNGDWAITNWNRYQETDSTAAERMRKHRLLRRNGSSTGNTGPGNTRVPGASRRNSRNVTAVPSRDRDVDVDRDRDRTAGEPARASSPAASTPDFDSYVPTDEQRARAVELHLDMTRALNSWRGKRKAAGITPADFGGDFTGWLEEEPRFQHANGNGKSGQAEPPSAIVRPPVYAPPPDPEVSGEQRAEIQRLAAETKAALRSDPTPVPRKSRSPLSREESLAFARGAPTPEAVTEKLQAETGQPTGGAAA